MTKKQFFDLAKKHVYGDTLNKEWSLGGSHGSCWGPELTFSEGEPEPEWIELDDIVEKVAPNITFFQYKRLLAQAESGVRHGGDYYGGSTATAYKSISVQKMCQWFIDHGFVTE